MDQATQELGAVILVRDRWVVFVPGVLDDRAAWAEAETVLQSIFARQGLKYDLQYEDDDLKYFPARSALGFDMEETYKNRVPETEYNKFDPEDCDACAEIEDLCTFHRGVDWGATQMAKVVTRAMEDC